MRFGCRFAAPAALSCLLVASPVLAHDGDDDGDALPCPVQYYNNVPMDEEFGAGTQAITECLKVRDDAKIVISVAKAHPANKNGVTQLDKANFLSNIDLMTANYEHVHGMRIGDDVKIASVHSSSGALLLTKRHKAWGLNADGTPKANPFIHLVEKGLADGYEFYICQMASRALGIKKDNVIDGVKFVPGGHIAVADFQLRGYALIEP